jgi:hypothetical protein
MAIKLIQKLIIVLGIVLVASLIIDWVPVQLGGADETTTPIEAPTTMAPPPQAPVPVLTSTVPVSITPPPQVAPAPEVKPQFEVFNFKIGDLSFKVAPFSANYGMTHLIYFENGTVREISPSANYTFVDKDKSGKIRQYSVFSLTSPKMVSPLRLNDNLTYYFMFPKDFKLKQNLKKLNNDNLNRLIDLIATYGDNRESRDPVKIVRTPTSTAVLFDSPGSHWLYSVKKGDTWMKSTKNRKLVNSDHIEDVQMGVRMGPPDEGKLDLHRRTIKSKTKYNCSAEAGALEFLRDLVYVPDLHGCPYESLN